MWLIRACPPSRVSPAQNGFISPAMNDYWPSSALNCTAGSTWVCSSCTPWSWFGSRPSASRIVGAICAVCTGLVTVFAPEARI